MEAYGERWGEQYERFREFGDEYMWIGWLYGAWHAHKGDSTEVRSLRDILSERAEASGNEEISLYAEALSGHLDLDRVIQQRDRALVPSVVRWYRRLPECSVRVGPYPDRTAAVG